MSKLSQIYKGTKFDKAPHVSMKQLALNSDISNIVNSPQPKRKLSPYRALQNRYLKFKVDTKESVAQSQEFKKEASLPHFQNSVLREMYLDRSSSPAKNTFMRNQVVFGQPGISIRKQASMERLRERAMKSLK